MPAVLGWKTNRDEQITIERYEMGGKTKRQLIFGGAGQGLQVDMFHHSWGKLSQLLEARIQVLVGHWFHT